MAVVEIIESSGVGARLHRALSRSTEYAEPFMVTAAALAIFGHPLFYLIWRFLIPQPFEDVSLRLAGSLVALRARRLRLTRLRRHGLRACHTPSLRPSPS